MVLSSKFVLTLFLFALRIEAEQAALYSCETYQSYLLVKKEDHDLIKEVKEINGDKSNRKGVSLSVKGIETDDYKFWLVCEEASTKIYEIVDDQLVGYEIELSFASEKKTEAENTEILYCVSLISTFSTKNYSSYKCSDGLKLEIENKILETFGEDDSNCDFKNFDACIKSRSPLFTPENKETFKSFNTQLILDNFDSQTIEIKNTLEYIQKRKFSKDSKNIKVTPDYLFDYLGNSCIKKTDDKDKPFILENKSKPHDDKEKEIQCVFDFQKTLIVKDTNGLRFSFYLDNLNNNKKPEKQPADDEEAQTQAVEESFYEIEKFFECEGLIFNENPNYIQLKLKSAGSEYNIEIPIYSTEKGDNLDIFIEKHFNSKISKMIENIYNLQPVGDNTCFGSNVKANSFQLVLNLINTVITHNDDKNAQLIYANVYDNDGSLLSIKDNHKGITNESFSDNESPESVSKYIVKADNLNSFIGDYDKAVGDGELIDVDDKTATIDMIDFSLTNKKKHALLAYALKHKSLVLYIKVFDFRQEFYPSILIEFSNLFSTNSYIVPVGDLSDTIHNLDTVYTKVKNYIAKKLATSKVGQNAELKIDEIYEGIKGQLEDGTDFHICDKEDSENELKVKIIKSGKTEEKEKDCKEHSKPFITLKKDGGKINVTLENLKMYNKELGFSTKAEFNASSQMSSDYTSQDFNAHIVHYITEHLKPHDRKSISTNHFCNDIVNKGKFKEYLEKLLDSGSASKDKEQTKTASGQDGQHQRRKLKSKSRKLTFKNTIEHKIVKSAHLLKNNPDF